MKIAETLSMVSSHQVPLDIHISNGTFLNHLHPQNTKLEVVKYNSLFCNTFVIIALFYTFTCPLL